MKLHLAFALLATVAVASAQTLAPLTQAHQTATTTLLAQRDAELARLRQPYLAALTAADQTATKAGNAAMLRAIELEREAVNSGKLRQELPPVLPRNLSPIRRALISSEQRAMQAFDGRQKALDTDYLQKLGALQLKAAREPERAEIVKEKTRVLSGIRGPITDLQTGLPGTQWRIFAGDGFQSLRFGEDGKVNGNWKYEVVGRDKVKVNWDKTSAMVLTLDRNGSSLTAGDKTWVLERQ